MGINQLDVSLKRILETELKDWNACFDYPSRINLVLTKLALQIEKVNFFKSDYGITIFFNFLEEFVKLKPSDFKVLIALNRVFQQIQQRINARPRINNNQIDIIIAYFKLLKTMRAQDLFTRKEITFSAKDLTNLIFVATQSGPFPMARFDIYAFLRLSFDIPRFLNKYSELTQSIFLLARAEKVFSSNSIFNASDSFHTLGYLGRLLHYYHAKPEFNYELPAALEEIKHNGKVLYGVYKPLIEEGLIKKGLLDFIFFKKFVSELTRDIPGTNLAQLCASDYSKHCNPDYKYFNSTSTCPKENFPQFVIQIEHHGLAQEEISRFCHAMNIAESEFKLLTDSELQDKSSFIGIRISNDRDDFNYVVKLFEGNTPSAFVGGLYFSKNKFGGTAYSVSPDTAIVVHEYVHHLMHIVLNNSQRFDGTINEGLSEFIAGGVCHPVYEYLRAEFVNDTTILKKLGVGKFPGYPDAHKWISFLINERPDFFKQLWTFYLEGKETEYFSAIRLFCNDTTPRMAFLEWAQLQSKVCSDYSKQYPDLEKSSLCLTDVSKQLAKTTVTEMSTSTVPLSSSMSNGLPIFTEKLLSPSSPKCITGGKKPLLPSQTSNSLPITTKKPTSPSSTKIIYEKAPYELYIRINVSLSVAKGILSAINRVGFEKFVQNHEPFLRRHPYLFLLARNIVEATTFSAMNLICFPSTKGILANYTELESAGLYFVIDMATSFGFGLVNAKIQPLFNARKEDGWMKYLVKNLGSTGLWTLFFLLSNASIILGEKFQDHKTEVLLSGILNALLVAIIHQFAYQGFNYVDNCLHASKKNTEPEQAPLQAPVSRQALFSKLNKPKLPKKVKKKYIVRFDETKITENNAQELLPRMGRCMV